MSNQENYGTLRIINPGEIATIRKDPLDGETLRAAEEIVNNVRKGGLKTFREYSEKFGDVQPGEELLFDKAAMKAAFDNLSLADQQMLTRTAERIRRFAQAQRDSIQSTCIDIPGGVAGQDVSPVDVAGCYAPGGRFPLPSSVMMTAITARVAGVGYVLVASPRPQPITLAAAHVSGADALLRVGGAHAVSAMAYGIDNIIPRCDVIAGPGNRWVTSAKKVVSGIDCAIDMLAGPSELVVYTDGTTKPSVVAADLLAQAEHDTDALPIVVTTDAEFLKALNGELPRQLKALSTKDTAEVAVCNGFAVLCASEDEAIDTINSLAPEHLEVLCANAQEVSHRMKHYGGMFIGEGAAEVLGDYGAGPNHTLPTSGTARFTGGLSVFHFLRIRTWMRIDDAAASQELVADSIRLARHEGLEGHARSAEQRLLD